MNSGMARIGFQPSTVWQFWQGIFRLPCGLRELAEESSCPPAAAAGNIRTQMTKLTRIVETNFPTSIGFDRNSDDAQALGEGRNCLSN